MSAAIHPITARFADPTLEQEFRHEEFERTIKRFTRFSVTLSAVVFLAYGVHDALVVSDHRDQAWAIRYAITVPVFGLVVPLMWTRAYERLHRPAMVLFGLAVNAVALLVGAVASHPADALYASYAPMFVVIGPFVARLDVVSQLVYTALALIMQLAIAFGLEAHGSVAERLSITTTLLSMGLIGTLVAHVLERQAREGFLQRRTIKAQLAELDREKRKAEDLLLNILPAAIAERLKSGAQPIADGFRDVTVLFADIVGFTAMSARLPPEQLVERLNAIFTAFDELVDGLGLEKIKTIGDAYMAVGGLDGRRESVGPWTTPEGDPDHVRAVAELALGMIARVAEFGRLFGEPLSVRIGIHTGPVVGGVIGKKKFIYDVWGDTVNTSSRMESHGAPGTIHVSEEAYARLVDDFVLEPRGEIEVKGKGPMRTWFLRGRK